VPSTASEFVLDPRLRWVSLAALAAAVLLLLPPTRQTWQTVYGARWLYVLLLSTLLSFGFTPVVMWLAMRFNILDHPEDRKVHTTPTPLMGGLAIYLAFTIGVLANSILDSQVLAILLGGSILALIGVTDDAFTLPASIKLVAQLLAVGIVIRSGVVLTLFSRSIVGNAADALLTIVWLLGITNAMNFFDGMDGLATGLSIITAGCLGLFAALTFQPFLGWFSAAVLGSCLGFLPFNFRPKKAAAIFLGDAGSTFLGFVLAALAVKGDWAENNAVDIAAPILIFWVFIYDMTYITAARILTGKVRSVGEWLAYVGRDHLHHRLASLLESKRQAVLLIFGFAVSTGLAAIALVHARTLEASLLVVQAVFVAAIFAILENAGNR
jgi:UDP-GlcNAc:undecaprenyl-phosphate GlcNAc-1-phosphate transferase